MIVACLCRPDVRYTTHDDAIPSNVTEFVLGGLKPATTYVVRLAAVNQAGLGPFNAPLPPVTTLPAGIVRHLCLLYQLSLENVQYRLQGGPKK